MQPASWSHGQESKFLFPSKFDPDTGKTKRIRVYFERNTVWCDVMGTAVVFTKTNRGQTFSDSREPKKRFSGEEVRAELIRMLGFEQGVSAYRHLL